MTREGGALGLTDLTSLEDDDTPETIAALCEQAVTPAGHVAAVCVHARFVRQAVSALRDTRVRVATVANFPAGAPDADAVAREVDAAVNAGADEVDVVLPYARYVAGDRDVALEVVRAARDASAGAVLKMILETGRLGSAETIHSAAADALDAGADFVETSTGTLQPGATREAARAMLEAIAGAGRGGFKASGGVRGAEDAAAYLALADELLGEGWASPATFRLALGVAGRTAGTGGF